MARDHTSSGFRSFLFTNTLWYVSAQYIIYITDTLHFLVGSKVRLFSNFEAVIRSPVLFVPQRTIEKRHSYMLVVGKMNIMFTYFESFFVNSLALLFKYLSNCFFDTVWLIRSSAFDIKNIALCASCLVRAYLQTDVDICKSMIQSAFSQNSCPWIKLLLCASVDVEHFYCVLELPIKNTDWVIL